MRLQSCFASLLIFARPILCQKPFIYPAPFKTTTNFGSNEVMYLESSNILQWTGNQTNSRRITIVMYQTLGDGQGLGDGEYIASKLLSIHPTTHHVVISVIVTLFHRKRNSRHGIFSMASYHGEESCDFTYVLHESVP